MLNVFGSPDVVDSHAGLAQNYVYVLSGEYSEVPDKEVGLFVLGMPGCYLLFFSVEGDRVVRSWRSMQCDQ
jgi:hypothetical protein